MKSTILSIVAALAVQEVAAHSMFQDLWVNGVDMQGTCVRRPPSNSPITSVSTTDIRCNVGGATGVAGKCPVVAGQTVTIEMHAQPGDRKCTDEVIGGAHYGPVLVYLSKVDNSATNDGSGGWFKIFQDTWSPKGSVGDNDNWGTNDLNACCGKMDVKIPSDIAPGDYLLRAEVIALHVAASSGGAQFYASCYQLTVTGSGSASPATVKFPGAYSASDPGILINIHASLSTYIAPGPTVYAGGSTRSAGAPCAGNEVGTATGAAYTPTNIAGSSSTGTAGSGSTGGTGSTGGSTGCTVAQFDQCGGNTYTGCTVCASGSTCSAVSPPYYSQCV